MRTESEEFRHYGKVLFIQSSVENGWYIVENGIVENGWCIPHTPPYGTAPGRYSKIVSICVDLCGVRNNKLRNLKGPRLEKS